MWMLRLNDMRSSKIEILESVCTAATKEELEELIKNQKVEVYKDTGTNSIHGDSYSYSKSFKKGGPLEWYNQPYDTQMGQHIISLEEVKQVWKEAHDVGICSDTPTEEAKKLKAMYENRIHSAECAFRDTIPLDVMLHQRYG